MNLGDILDAAFRLLRANYRALFVVTVLIAAPLELLGSWLERNQSGAFGVLNVLHRSTTPAATTNVAIGPLLGSLGVALLLAVVAPLATGAVCRIVSASYLGEALGGRQALRLTARRYPALLASSIVLHLIEVAGLILCILPGLAFVALFAATTAIVSLEGAGPLAALSRSWQLMRRRFWAVLGVVVVAFVLTAVVADAFSVIPDLLAGAIGHPWGFVLAGVGAAVVECFTLSMTGTVGTLLLFDARIRWEGLDLDIMAQRYRTGA